MKSWRNRLIGAKNRSCMSRSETFLTVNLALITLRYIHPDHVRPFRVPGAIGRMPVLPLAAIASIILLLIHFDWQIYVAGGIALVLSAIAFFVRWWVRAGRRR